METHHQMPSGLQQFTEHSFEWVIIIVSLIFLVYLARTIKNEKSSYLAKASLLDFKNFQLLIPSWWSLEESKISNTLSYKRTDTYYDWKAKFSWLPLREKDNNKDLKEIFAELVSDKNIQFDTAEAVIKEKEQFISHPLHQSPETDFIRVEGTATEDYEHRIYYDAFLVKDTLQNGLLFCESRSSILNGMLEGPYFEEVICRMDKKREP